MSTNDRDIVLIAYDGSEHAKEAIARAGRELRTGRPAVVLTVWNPLESMPFAGVGAVTFSTEVDEGFVKQAEETAQEGAELAVKAGFDATTRVERTGGPLWRSIVNVADELEPGVVVMGSHGRSGVGLALMGSVATGVAHHVKRPVLISSKR
jgi:nucleotide-binding universal stress UspA family protein